MGRVVGYCIRRSWTRPRQWQSSKSQRYVLWYDRKLRFTFNLQRTDAARLVLVERVKWDNNIPSFTMLKDYRDMERRKVVKLGETSGGLGVGVQSVLLAKTPNLLLHCAMLQYSDGSGRKPGYITIRTQGDQWQVTATDVDVGAILRTEEATLDDALIALEVLMGDSAVPWVLAPWLKPEGKKKKSG